jgi:hypothetical protein
MIIVVVFVTLKTAKNRYALVLRFRLVASLSNGLLPVIIANVIRIKYYIKMLLVNLAVWLFRFKNGFFSCF